MNKSTVKKMPNGLHPDTFKGYKYNILERLFNYTPTYKNSFIESVARNSNRSQAGVKKIIYMKNDDTSTVDYNILKVIAAHFTVPVEKLENPIML